MRSQGLQYNSREVQTDDIRSIIAAVLQGKPTQLLALYASNLMEERELKPYKQFQEVAAATQGAMPRHLVNLELKVGAVP
jgi:hypothetical protein